MIRKTVYYSGRVQGVGFRATARHIARDHSVTGYVRNLPDGRVLMVAEGEEAAVDALLADIAGRMEKFIRSRTVESGAGTGEFTGFGILY